MAKIETEDFYGEPNESVSLTEFIKRTRSQQTKRGMEAFSKGGRPKRKFT